MLLLSRWVGIGPGCSIINEPVLVLGCLKWLGHAQFTVRAFDDIVSRSRCHVLWLRVIVLHNVSRRFI